MAQITLNVNGKSRMVDVDPTTPLLYVLRDDLELHGPRFGCGLSQCGACTVIIDGSTVRSCSYPVSSAKNKQITTLEGSGHGSSSSRAASGVHRRAGGAVRLLHERHDHDGQGSARQESASERRRHQAGIGWQSVPLRQPPAGDPRGEARRGRAYTVGVRTL